MPRESKRAHLDEEWFIDTIATLSGGVNTALPDDLIADEECVEIENLSIRDGRVRQDKGFAELGVNTTLRGTPKGGRVHRSQVGTETFLLITDLSVYKYVPGVNKSIDQWHYVPWGDAGGGRTAGGATTLSANEAGGQTVISVVDENVWNVNDYVGIELDDGTQHQSRVNAKAAGTITIDDALPSAAAAGKAAILAVLLAGTDSNQVVSVAVPSHAWVAFVNGVDFPMRYDGTDVRDIPGLNAVLTGGGDTARTISLFKAGHLVLGNVTQAGSRRPYRLVWCDAGDPELWVGGDAGDNDLLDADDDLIALAPLGDDMVAYRKNSIVKMTYLGQEGIPFRFDTVIHGLAVGAQGVGAVAPNAVFHTEQGHIVQSGDGIYFVSTPVLSNGTAQDISNSIFETLFSPAGDYDASRSFRNFINFSDLTNEVFCNYVSINASTYCDRAWVLDIEKGTWRKRLYTKELTFAAYRSRSSDEGVRIADLIGTIAEQSWVIGGSSTIVGAPLTVIGIDGENETHQIDQLLNTEDGDDIPWKLKTKRITSFDRYIRVSWTEIEYSSSGPISLWRRKDNGQLQLLTVLAAQPIRSKRRVSIEFVDRSLQYLLTGDSGDPEIGRLSFKWREESPWSL